MPRRTPHLELSTLNDDCHSTLANYSRTFDVGGNGVNVHACPDCENGSWEDGTNPEEASYIHRQKSEHDYCNAASDKILQTQQL